MKILESKSFWTCLGFAHAICLVVLLLFLAVVVPSFGMWFYYWQYGANDTYNVVNMLPHHLHDVTLHMIEYMQGLHERELGLQIMTYVGGVARPFFSPIEIRHMVDVYDLFAIGYVIRNAAAGLLVVTTLLFSLKGRRYLKLLYKGWLFTAVGVVALLALLAGIIAVNWHQAFVIFHEIFFDNDYWILDRRIDLLVNIVPYEFFITLSVVIAAFFAAGLGLMSALAIVALKKKKRRLGLVFLLIFSAVITLWALGIFGVVLRIVLYILLGLICILLLILAVVMFCKIRYEVRIKKANIEAEWKYKARVIWLWGLFKRDFSPQDITKEDSAKNIDTPQPQKEKEIIASPQTPSEKQKSSFNFDTIGSIINHSFALLKRIFAVCRPKHCVIKGKYGAEEPHTTGLVLGAVGALAPQIGIDTHIEGDFESPALQLDIDIKGNLRIYALVIPTVSFLLKPEIRSIIKSTIFKRKPTKKKEKG